MGIEFRQAIPIPVVPEVKEAPKTFEYEAEVCFTGDSAWAGMQVGVGCGGKGYALMASMKDQCVHFMEVNKDAVLIDRGMRRLPLKKGAWYPIRAAYDGKILRLWLNENPLDDDPWPKFEFELELPGPGVALDCREGAAFRNESLTELAPQPELGETFTNPVIIGADPDVLCHEGMYYIYNRIPNDPNSVEDKFLYNGSELAGMDEAGEANAIFRVACSRDLVHWSAFKPCLFRPRELEDAFCMSPNVFHKDGYFYLLFAAGRFGRYQGYRLFYGVADNPMGPFEMKTTAPLHEDQQEIGGMPFVDEDGQVYITYVRFDRGNHIWMQRLQVENGVITPEDDTFTHVISPEADYEIDNCGRITEGGVIIPHKGRYYMIYACCGYETHYGEAYAVADNVFGPYKRYAHNPILHHHFRANGTGDGIVIYNADRTRMYMGYHRHVSPTEIEPRMTCLDPMKFVPDPDGGPDILAVRGPSTVPQPMPFTE